MGAAADCELIGPGFFGQPVNSVTSIAFAVAGVILWQRPRLRWIAGGLVATGIGSFLFHGPMPAGSQWAHDVSLAWLIVLVAGLGQTWEKWTKLPALSGLGVGFALLPVVADPTAVLATAFALLVILRRDRSLRTIAPLTLLAIAAVLGRLGATGGPWCEPGSVFQWHAIWHIAAAVAVAWWALGTER